MDFSLQKSIEVLERTPVVIKDLLENISDDWSISNEGRETWSPYDIVGHLIHGDNTDWMNRVEIILSVGNVKNFKPFDRFAQFKESKGKTLNSLLDEFAMLRNNNLDKLKSKKITANRFGQNRYSSFVRRSYITPASICQWTVHDLNHIAQISRVMAHQYKDQVWSVG